MLDLVGSSLLQSRERPETRRLERREDEKDSSKSQGYPGDGLEWKQRCRSNQEAQWEAAP